MEYIADKKECDCGHSHEPSRGHDHAHGEGNVRKTIIKIIVSVILAVAALIVVKIFEIDKSWLQALVYLPAFLTIGLGVVIEAVENLFRGNIFDENLLMIIASIGAFALSDYLEGMAVMILFQTGEVFQTIGVAKSRKSISGLMDIKPETANREISGRPGSYEEVKPEEILPGDILLVKPGEKIPLDGIVTEGEATADTSALTGESIPSELKPGSTAVSGCILLSKPVKIKVTKEYKDSTVAKILYLVENASERKSKSENFITKFARIYTPVVVISAILLAVLPPLITGAGWSTWMNRALSFLVISCPCALVISVPMSFYMGIGAASKKGILIKGSQYVDTLSRAEIVAFDKTGTLTKGKFEVTEVHAQDGFQESELLRLVATAESFSNHPIALSAVAYYTDKTGAQIDQSAVQNFEEISGTGIRAVVNGKMLLAGNENIAPDAYARECMDKVLRAAGSAIIFASIDGQYAGYIAASDTIKPETAIGIQTLKNTCGVRKTVMLTGDSENTARRIAAEAGVDEVHAKCLPENKVEILESIKKEMPGRGSLLFVGDGINDAPVLTAADVGIAMGGIGSDAAIEAADAVIMKDDISAVAKAVNIAKKTVSTARANIVFSLGIKAAILILSVFGISNLWIAVFADVGVSVIAIMNALLIGKKAKG